MHGTQWVILLYWVPSDRFLLRFCDTYSDAELSSHPVKGGFGRAKLLIAKVKRKRAAPLSSAQRLSFKDRKLCISVPVNNVSSDICRQDAFCALYTDGISCRKQFRYRSQQRTPLGRGKISGCIAGSQESPASLFRNPKNTFEHQPHSTAFY